MMARPEDVPEWRSARAVLVGNSEYVGNPDEKYHREVQAAMWMHMIDSAEDPEELEYARAYVARKLAKLPRWLFCQVIYRIPDKTVPPPTTRVQAAGNERQVAVHLARALQGKAGLTACGIWIGARQEPTWLPESAAVTCGHCVKSKVGPLAHCDCCHQPGWALDTPVWWDLPDGGHICEHCLQAVSAEPEA